VARLAGWVTASSQILDTGEAEDDLIKDMTEVVISFCVRLYGHLGVRSRVLRAVDCAQAV
jgi:putative resolvase